MPLLTKLGIFFCTISTNITLLTELKDDKREFIDGNASCTTQ